MANPPLQLVIGNYNTSSWSLRAALVLRLAHLAFVETRVPLRRPETPEWIARFSPSGKLPVLIAEGVPIWDSLAIAEFMAELEPSIWPVDPVRRAEARSISAEMHSGFNELRRLMPMDIVSRFNPPGKLPRRLAADIERVKAIWRRCRQQHAADGPFLFGAFSVADAMFAPVATRLLTHGVPIEGPVEDYVDSVMAWPDMVAWCDAAAAEQDERLRQGSLDVVERIVPGRVLDVDAQGTEPVWRQLPPADDQERPVSMQPLPADPPSHPPAVAQPAAATTADAPEQPEESGPEAMPEAAEEAGEPLLVRAVADQPGPTNPPLEGVAEPQTPPVMAERPAPLEWAEASQDTRREPALPPLPPLEPKGRAERPATPAPRKLGWIRRPVPQEHLDEVEERAPASHPLRRAALGIESSPGERDKAHSGGKADHDSTGSRPKDEPQSDEHQARERPGDSRPDGEDRARERQARERQDAPGRPPAPPVKPIGGGILRRR